MLAEARGDAATASRLLSDGASEDDAQHLADLAAMERHGEQAPPWLVGRWITRQALRWMRLRGDERYEQSLYLCLQGTYWSRADVTAGDLPPDYAKALADDWVTRELALYGYRVLDEFLDDVAHPRLVEAAGSVASWTRMPLRPYRLADRGDDRLVVSDLVTGCGHEVFDLGTGAFYPLGAEVLGRLVPVDDELWMFETLPLLIDRRTSVDIASALPPHHANPLPWAPLLTRAIDQGRLPRMLGAGLRTPVFDDLPLLDLPDLEWEPPDDERWAELVAAGLDDEMAGWVQVLEEALTMLPRQPAALPAVVDSLDRVLASETAMAVVRDHLTGVEVAAGWEALARQADGELRSACADLAATARERGDGRW
jgi:hypothetical protein